MESFINKREDENFFARMKNQIWHVVIKAEDTELYNGDICGDEETLYQLLELYQGQQVCVQIVIRSSRNFDTLGKETGCDIHSLN